MSYDRFVVWQGDTRPSKDDVGRMIEDFFGAALERAYWERSRWFVQLHGRQSWPLARQQVSITDAYRAYRLAESGEPRCLEVFFDAETAEHFSVITRRCDEYTAALAQGLAELIARTWNGKVEQG